MRSLRAVVVVLVLFAGGACADLGGGAEGVDVEALRPKAAAVTDLLIENDWKAVRADFDETMRKGLAEDGLANGWDQVVAEKGQFVARGEPTQIPKPGRNLAVFDTPLTFEKGEMKSRVVLRPNGEIAGLFILVPEAD